MATVYVTGTPGPWLCDDLAIAADGAVWVGGIASWPSCDGIGFAANIPVLIPSSRYESPSFSGAPYSSYGPKQYLRRKPPRSL